MFGLLSQIGFDRMRQENAGAERRNKSGYQFKHWKSPVPPPRVGAEYRPRVSGWFRQASKMVSIHNLG
jgi:hypothetical protein